MTPLSKSRETIEAIDRELIRLVHERMVAIREVGRLKGADPDQPLRDVRREHELFEFWAAEGEQYDLSAYHLGRILRELLTWSRRDQERFLEGEDSPRARQDVVQLFPARLRGHRHHAHRSDVHARVHHRGSKGVDELAHARHLLRAVSEE